MQSVIEQLRSMPEAAREAALATLTEDEAASLLYDWGFWARPEQLPPEGDWFVWLILAGRGFGKTRTGAEWIKKRVQDGARNIALIAETAADGRDVMVEGVSGLLNIYPEDERPLYESSKRRVTWKNGATATLFNATEPDQLRGPQFDTAWCDELAKWRYAKDTWDQLMFGLRLGDPQVCVTTTPRPIETVRDIVRRSIRDPRWIVTKGRTLDNVANLSKDAVAEMMHKYDGTRLGRQELEGEILDDAPGALWTRDMLDDCRIKEVDTPEKIVVAVDPAVTNNEGSDEHGIVVAGATGNDGYVLEDASTKGSPEKWARRAISMFHKYEADYIVAEVNQGGDMVEHTLRSIEPRIPFRKVHATRGKHVRAEPIASMYEQGRVKHLGQYPELEDQMMLMTNAGYEGENSPDRLDACVWALTDLMPLMSRRIPEETYRAPRRANPVTGY